jgi:protein-S-isoprenylcysteine O-methyltransferase Ste14
VPSWLAPAAYLVGTVAMFVLRAPHIRRSTQVPVTLSRIGAREKVLVSLVAVGLLLLPLLWLTTDLLACAERPPRAWAFGAGLVAYALGLWLLHRSHVDLGRNWSNTLQIREGHRVVTEGVYRRIRHPMYAALLLHALGQALVVPNWLAGPGFLVAFVLLVALRLGPEERLMLETFGPTYAQYQSRTRRLLPGVW